MECVRGQGREGSFVSSINVLKGKEIEYSMSENIILDSTMEFLVADSKVVLATKCRLPARCLLVVVLWLVGGLIQDPRSPDDLKPQKQLIFIG
jgi:hypothetical protein